MRRASAALLARAAAGLASTSGPPAPALTLRALSPAASSSSSFTTLHPPVGGRWWRPEYRTAEAGGRTFAALPAAGEKDVHGSGVNGGPPPPPAPPRRSSVSGHDREVTVADIGIPQAVQTARDVLHHAALVHFRESLEHESETRLSMPFPEALALAKACGVATTDAEAAAALAAAHSAGLVLRFQGTVFLRPSEVADLVLRALPDTDLEVRARLATLEAALEPLDAQKRAIEGAARRRSRLILWAGLAAFTGQLGVYAYLTWGHPHWGWDATEPWTFMSTQALIIFSYAFYMVSRRPLDPREVEAHLAATAVKAGVKEHGFNAAAHARLASDVARYRRYLERQQSHGEAAT